MESYPKENSPLTVLMSHASSIYYQNPSSHTNFNLVNKVAYIEDQYKQGEIVTDLLKPSY